MSTQGSAPTPGPAKKKKGSTPTTTVVEPKPIITPPGPQLLQIQPQPTPPAQPSSLPEESPTPTPNPKKKKKKKKAASSTEPAIPPTTSSSKETPKNEATPTKPLKPKPTQPKPPPPQLVPKQQPPHIPAQPTPPAQPSPSQKKKKQNPPRIQAQSTPPAQPSSSPTQTSATSVTSSSKETKKSGTTDAKPPKSKPPQPEPLQPPRPSAEAIPRTVQPPATAAEFTPTPTPTTVPLVRLRQIDKFFSQFPDFEYNPHNHPSSEFQRLGELKGWDRDGASDIPGEAGNARYNFKSALVMQFHATYGKDKNSLSAWQELCRTLRYDPIPDMLEGCRALVMSTHVNLVDLLAFKSTGEEVTKFSSEVALSNYTIGTDSYFPREHVLAGSLIYYLLRNILNPSLDRGRRRTDHTGRERKRKADRDHVRGGDRGQSGRG